MTESAPLIVSTDWLMDRMSSAQQKIRVLDATWSSTRDCRDDYKEKHIPSSVFFEIMRGAVHTKTLINNMPDGEAFQEQARECGVDQDTHVVVYDSLGNAGLYMAGRAWFLFKYYGMEKVSMLDGGLRKWEAEKKPITKDVPSVQRGNFTSKVQPHMRTEFEQMLDIVAKKSRTVVDSRPVEKFTGAIPEGKGGHIPGAISMPLASHLLTDGERTLKSPEQLKEVFEQCGVDLTKPLVATCNSGMSACTLLVAMLLCGSKDCTMYHGSITEWSIRAPDQLEKP